MQDEIQHRIFRNALATRTGRAGNDDAHTYDAAFAAELVWTMSVIK